MNYKEEYQNWLLNVTSEEKAELERIKDSEDEIKDRFYKSLEFGTAGIRGVIGLGLNRMNSYIVARATQGLCNQLIKSNPGKDLKVTIAYDSRIKSDEFAKTAASVLAAAVSSPAASQASMPPSRVYTFAMSKPMAFRTSVPAWA